MAQVAAAEGPALELPARFKHQLQKARAGTLGAGYHHFRPRPSLGGHGQQQVVATFAHDGEPVAGSQIVAAHPHGVAIGIDKAAADAGEIKAGQQRLYRRRRARHHCKAGPGGLHLFVDVELGSRAIPDRRRHEHKAFLAQVDRLKQGAGPGRIGCPDTQNGRECCQSKRRGAGIGQTHRGIK